MNYLVVSCTTYDMAGRAMIQGAINAISEFDHHAHFCSLEKPGHHAEWIGWYREPEQNVEAFRWADVILDIAGLHTNQGNKYIWKELREKYRKPYVFMSQSFMEAVDPELFNNTFVICRGILSVVKLYNKGVASTISPDLSFMIKPKPVFNADNMPYHPKRVYSTHFCKDWEAMLQTSNVETDVQIIEKKFQGTVVWEPAMGINTFSGPPEEIFGLVAQAESVYTSRYQIAVAAVLSGKIPIIFGRNNTDYDDKYTDLMSLYGKSSRYLRENVLSAVKSAYEYCLENIGR